MKKKFYRCASVGQLPKDLSVNTCKWRCVNCNVWQLCRLERTLCIRRIADWVGPRVTVDILEGKRVKLSSYRIRKHIGGVGVWLHSLLNFGARWRRDVNLSIWQLYPWVKDPWYPLHVKSRGPHRWGVNCAGEKISLPARIRAKVTLFPRPQTSHCTEFFVRFVPFYLPKDTPHCLGQMFCFNVTQGTSLPNVIKII